MKSLSTHFILWIALALFCCGCQKLHQGFVIYKEFVPEHTSHGNMMAGRAIIPTSNHYPDEWDIWVKGVGEKGDTIIRCFSVSKSQFYLIKIGDFVKTNPNSQTTKRMITF